MLRYLALLLPLLAAACSQERAHAAVHPDGYETLTLRYQGWTSQVSYPELAEELGYLAPLKLQYIGNTISGPQDIQTVVTRDVDFGVAFNGAIVNLVAAGAPIKAVIAVYFIDDLNWNGFFVLDGSPLQHGRDLIGKKVGMNTLGAHAEFMLREWLGREGLRREEIAQVTLLAIPPISGEQSLRQKQTDVASLSGVLRDKALERGGIHPIFRDVDLFGKLTTASYVMHDRFLRENPKTAAKFVEATARALEWTRKTPAEEVRTLMRKIVEKRGRDEVPALIRYWLPTSAEEPGGVLTNAQMQIWIDWLVKDGQLKPGQVQPDALFTNRFNPYATH